MESEKAVGALSALAHPGRLEVFRRLVQAGPRGLAAGEIARATGSLPNTLSTNLNILAGAGLVASRREGRSIIYTAAYERMRELLAFLMDDCCGGKPEICTPPWPKSQTEPAPSARLETEMSDMDRPLNVLFLCTGNSARSVLAEALLRSLGGDRFRAYSAGSFPTGKVNVNTYPILRSLGFDPADFRSKSWDEFAGADAPPIDFIFTVCDNAAGEVCPIWPGKPMTAHWGVPDPAAAVGTPAEIALAFSETARQLRSRIAAFVALPLEKLDRVSLQTRLREIGSSPAAAAQ